MEEPEDAPPLPPGGVDDDILALQHSGLHNVSNTCYLNATVQVRHSSKKLFLMMCLNDLFLCSCYSYAGVRVVTRAFGVRTVAVHSRSRALLLTSSTRIETMISIQTCNPHHPHHPLVSFLT